MRILLQIPIFILLLIVTAITLVFGGGILWLGSSLNKPLLYVLGRLDESDRVRAESTKSM